MKKDEGFIDSNSNDFQLSFLENRVCKKEKEIKNHFLKCLPTRLVFKINCVIYYFDVSHYFHIISSDFVEISFFFLQK